MNETTKMETVWWTRVFSEIVQVGRTRESRSKLAGFFKFDGTSK